MWRRIPKACDSCRYRKVKCSGEQPCYQCSHLDLECAYSAPNGKRKPGVRGRLVAHLREQTAARTAEPTSSGSGDGSSSASTSVVVPVSDVAAAAATQPAVTSITSIINNTDNTETQALPPSSITTFTPGSTTSASYEPSPSDFTPDFFLSLIPDFESLVYPVNPVITPEELRTAISIMHSSLEDAALVYAFAAVTINLTQTSWHLNGDVASQVTDLVRLCLQSHRQGDLSLTASREASGAPILTELCVTVKRAVTCIFLEISLMAFKLFDRSFTILREAISMVQTLKVFQHTEGSLSPSLSSSVARAEIARRQRLYWECFIHERFVNIMSGHPPVLPPLKTGLPIVDTTIPPHVDVGFRRLIHLFVIMDDSFLAHWNARQLLHVPEMTAEWVERKQAQIDQDERAAEQQDSSSSAVRLTELQLADLFITRLWLRTLVWQLALSHGLLRSAPSPHIITDTTNHQNNNNNSLLSLHYPARRLSSQLRNLVCRLDSVASIGFHGSGILQKLFEITTTVADVLALPTSSTNTNPSVSIEEDAIEEYSINSDRTRRLEDFIFLVRFMFCFERIPMDERDYLREKVEVLRDKYNNVVDFSTLTEQ